MVKTTASFFNIEYDFSLIQTVSKEAKKVIKENSKIILLPEDKKLILDLLNNPPSPNDKLKAADKHLTNSTHEFNE
ncbi:DUF1778 domain-containing protein [Photorhabdus caribbeanensis]|uniref:type II toxin-antitoxin system TacA family antitoxin n=1 Tax=Photorhabdus caribbeanensis TaxID=1004165 RepID=UPI001BD21AC6|nr:DUF1778 domain-containing protein [Photorhabdus caribbeanensis]